jgi:hypothetical protein
MKITHVGTSDNSIEIERFNKIKKFFRLEFSAVNLGSFDACSGSDRRRPKRRDDVSTTTTASPASDRLL